jgi:hypothetical protein
MKPPTDRKIKLRVKPFLHFLYISKVPSKMWDEEQAVYELRLWKNNI